MKAYAIEQFGIAALSPVEREYPRPKPGEVVVKLHAGSLNFRDIMVVSGTYNPRMKLPAIPLSDAAGEVVELGEGVTKWEVGDRVMPTFVQQWFDGEPTEAARRTALGAGPRWDGLLREVAAIHEDGLVRIPEHLSFVEAATLPCAAVTAWNALVVSGNVKPGDTVLTLGSGGVSVFAIQIAKMAGARVIATSGSDEKIKRLKALGADETINYREVENWDRAVNELTNGNGVDHVVEIGGAGTLERSINSVRVGGHIALIGAVTGSNSVVPIQAVMRSIRLQGIFVGSRAMFEDLAKAVGSNKLSPVVDRVFGFGDARKAFEHMNSGSHFGKVVIDYTQE